MQVIIGLFFVAAVFVVLYALDKVRIFLFYKNRKEKVLISHGSE